MNASSTLDEAEIDNFIKTHKKEVAGKYEYQKGREEFYKHKGIKNRSDMRVEKL